MRSENKVELGTYLRKIKPRIMGIDQWTRHWIRYVSYYRCELELRLSTERMNEELIVELAKLWRTIHANRSADDGS